MGGVNQYIETLKKELEENGHKVDILSHHPGMLTLYKHSYTKNQFGWNIQGSEIDKSINAYSDRYTIKDVINSQVYQYYKKHLPHVEPMIRWREIERYTYEVAAALLDLSGYDIIHTHDILSTRAIWNVKPKHIPLVATIHGILATEYINAGDIKSVDSLRWKYAATEEFYGHMSTDATIVPTQWQRNQLSAHYHVPSEKINVIPYGMDLIPFLKKVKYAPYPPLKEHQKKSNQIVIACPARLVPEKDHQTLFEALRILKEKREDFVCWIIGDGKLRDELVSLSNRLGLHDQIHFFGNRYDVASLLGIADIVVLALIQDMHPFSLMEAQVAGIPCVASNAGGIPEIVRHEDTGLIFEKRNSVQLADQILKLMNQPELRSKLAENAAKWGVERYSSKTLFNHTMNIYQQTTSAKQANQSRLSESADQTIQSKQASEQGTIEQPNLIGKYGLVKERVGHEGPSASIFKFEVEALAFDKKQWRQILERIPATYSLPDTAYIQVLAEERIIPPREESMRKKNAEA